MASLVLTVLEVLSDTVALKIQSTVDSHEDAALRVGNRVLHQQNQLRMNLLQPGLAVSSTKRPLYDNRLEMSSTLTENRSRLLARNNQSPKSASAQLLWSRHDMRQEAKYDTPPTTSDAGNGQHHRSNGSQEYKVSVKLF